MNTYWTTYIDLQTLLPHPLMSRKQDNMEQTQQEHNEHAATGLRLPLKFAVKRCDTLQSSQVVKKLNKPPVGGSASVAMGSKSAQSCESSRLCQSLACYDFSFLHFLPKAETCSYQTAIILRSRTRQQSSPGARIPSSPQQHQELIPEKHRK